MAVTPHVHMWFLCGIIPSVLGANVRMDDIRSYGQGSIVSLLMQEVHDLKGKLEIVDTSQTKEVEDLKWVVTKQGKEVANLQGMVTVQRKEVEDLKGVVTAQRKEVDDLRGVVTAQRKEVDDLRGVVTAVRKEVEDFKDIVFAQRDLMRNLEGVLYERRLLGLGPFDVSTEQDETMETTGKQLNNIYEYGEWAKMGVHTKQNNDNNNAGFEESFRGLGYNVTTTAGKETVVRNEHSVNDKDRDVYGDQDLSMSLAGNVMSSGKISRGTRAASHVAFSASLSHVLLNMGIGRTIKFDKVLLNDGVAYNSHTGIFTAPISGVYLFTFTILDYGYTSSDKPAVQLVVDDAIKVAAQIQPASALPAMGGNTAILRVIAGQAVWLQTFGRDNASLRFPEPSHVVSFSGVLMYQ